MKIAALGAGYMGTALAEIAAQRGHTVRLWGTWLDDEMIDAVAHKKPHPKLQVTLHPGVEAVRSSELSYALRDAELVLWGISSDGVAGVMERARGVMSDVPMLSVTKGFLPGADGRMHRIDEVAESILQRPVSYVHAAGPAKAFELVRGVLTWMCFASKHADHARICAEAMGGSHLRVSVTDDLAGSLISSALKNAYATGLGLWDGWVGTHCHNARAACFQQAVVEMACLVEAAGGRTETVMGPSGVGDLHVTAAAGRNRAFGERVGKGGHPQEVAAAMLASGELTEGYPAIRSAHQWAKERGLVDRVPLLSALHRIVWEGASVESELSRLVLSTGPR